MVATHPIALILGAGPRIGASVAEKLASNGYKVAIASRKGTGAKTAEGGFLSLQADFANHDSIAAVFDAVKTEFHAAPSVVIYNAATLTPPPDPESLFSLPVERFVSDFTINTTSAYVAAQHAVSGWATLPEGTKKTFIYTGNTLNTTILPVPTLLTLGVGKAASAYWVGLADAAYSTKGFRFFYADERYENGESKGQAVDGPAHAEFYTQLVEHVENVPWHATFVKDKGYVKF